MAGFFDSSILLGWLLNQPGHDKIARLWHSEPIKVSSILIEAECLTVLRRAAHQLRSEAVEPFLAPRLARLERDLKSLVLKNLDEEVMACLWNEPKLRSCRTLEAVHLATAILFQQNSDTPITIYSLDERMKEAAIAIGFRVAP